VVSLVFVYGRVLSELTVFIAIEKAKYSGWREVASYCLSVSDKESEEVVVCEMFVKLGSEHRKVTFDVRHISIVSRCTFGVFVDDPTTTP